jgi:hypothetical protein
VPIGAGSEELHCLRDIGLGASDDAGEIDAEEYMPSQKREMPSNYLKADLRNPSVRMASI